MSARVEISDSAQYGATWTSKDAELADRFEDFLTERCFVLFKTRFERDVALHVNMDKTLGLKRETFTAQAARIDRC